MAKFVSFDGGKNFYNVNSIASVRQYGAYNQSIIGFNDGSVHVVQMTVPQAMTLIRHAV